jgi:protein-S-isoprenylcysteine O-methyltransferase
MSVFWSAAAAWAVGEAALFAWTSRGGTQSRDASTTMLTTSVLAGTLAAAIVGGELDELTIPGPDRWPAVAGVTLLAAGFGLRVWSVRTLGRFFKYRVVVQEGHEVIRSGPYRRIRHPAYTGMIICSAGLGLTLGNWLSLIVATAPTATAFTLQLLREERTLAAELGAPYREYMARTWRLVPHVW